MNWRESHCLLLNGDYDNGWPSHDIIVRDNPQHGTCLASDFGKTIWNGEVEPIILLVNAEFGDGDTIHFLRFLELASSRVNKIILRCNQDFKKLFPNLCIVGKEEPLPNFDKIIHMMALPKVLGIKKNDINGSAYIFPNQYEPPPMGTQIISLMNFFKAGICWAGNPFNNRDTHRSIEVDLFNKLSPEGFHFFSLNNLFEPPKNCFDTRQLMKDWNETAHLVKIMNLVITVDTSIAHLAGALGVPVWLLVSPDSQEWRWGTNDDKTIWYDSMTIFRKTTTWDLLLKEVFEKFIIHVSSWSQEKSSGVLGGSSEPVSILSV